MVGLASKDSKLINLRCAVAADNERLLREVVESLRTGTGQTPLACPFATIREHLTRDTNGVLLVGVTTLADRVEARRLVQDISLQKLPPVVVLIDELGVDSDLADLEPYVARRVLWPEQASEALSVIRSVGRCREFHVAREESLEELLSRRLLALTPSLLPLVDRIALAACHDVTILLNGETGTGKTYLARLMHEYSPRRQHRFLTIPCGAIAANLVESEFFGHVRGAFTGADRPKVGKFAAVGEGTLLLDEIDTLGMEQQATLLRVIETGEFEPVGSTETQKCLARLVVASNIDLEEAVERNRFRPDLYFRLNVMSFHLPPLRERVSDIGPLARGMAARFNRKFNKDLFDIHPEAIAALESYSWPGNLRQLENVVQHAVLVSSGTELLWQHLPPALQDQATPRLGEESVNAVTLDRQREVIERNIIQRALISNGYSRTRTAASLGISRVTLYKKMDKYGLLDTSKRERANVIPPAAGS
jgi:two-component system, NtrC family, response regulator HydG